MDEWSRCRFCKWYTERISCTVLGCSNYSRYKPNKAEIIEKARETGMSITDVVSLVTLD